MRNPFVNVLKAYSAPVTREEYLNTAWAGNPPDPLGAELESMLPDELQENPEEGGVMDWLKERGIRKGVACWRCDRCQRHHPEKWTRIEHRAECPNRYVVRERYREVEGTRAAQK